VNNDHGLSLIEMMVAASVAGIFVLLATTIMGQIFQSQLQTKSLQEINGIRSGIITDLDNLQIWNATKAANPSFACIANQLPCPVNPQAFTPVDQNGNPILTAFSQYGSNCAIGSCMARFNLTWAPLCLGGVPCVPSQLRITGTLTVVGPQYLPPMINTSTYGFTVFKAAQ
jgi:prepilin-type N-terminal cleavage/methylation domain-containing protein